jgi:hypothetical protein
MVCRALDQGWPRRRRWSCCCPGSPSPAPRGLGQPARRFCRQASNTTTATALDRLRLHGRTHRQAQSAGRRPPRMPGGSRASGRTNASLGAATVAPRSPRVEQATHRMERGPAASARMHRDVRTVVVQPGALEARSSMRKPSG